MFVTQLRAALLNVFAVVQFVPNRHRRFNARHPDSMGSALTAQLGGGQLLLQLQHEALPDKAISIAFHLANHASVEQLLVSLGQPDCFLVAYDGSRLWTTPLGAHALATGVQLAHPDHLGPAAAAQLLTAALAGWRVLVPLAGREGGGGGGMPSAADVEAAVADAATGQRALPEGDGLARLMALDSLFGHTAGSADALPWTQLLGIQGLLSKLGAVAPAAAERLERQLEQCLQYRSKPWEAARLLAGLAPVEAWVRQQQERLDGSSPAAAGEQASEEGAATAAAAAAAALGGAQGPLWLLEGVAPAQGGGVLRCVVEKQLPGEMVEALNAWLVAAGQQQPLSELVFEEPQALGMPLFYGGL